MVLVTEPLLVVQHHPRDFLCFKVCLITIQGFLSRREPRHGPDTINILHDTVTLEVANSPANYLDDSYTGELKRFRKISDLMLFLAKNCGISNCWGVLSNILNVFNESVRARLEG